MTGLATSARHASRIHRACLRRTRRTVANGAMSTALARSPSRRPCAARSCRASRSIAATALGAGLALAAILPSGRADAAIFKCIALDGSVSYARTPCAGEALDERLGEDGRPLRPGGTSRGGRGAGGSVAPSVDPSAPVPADDRAGRGVVPRAAAPAGDDGVASPGGFRPMPVPEG